MLKLRLLWPCCGVSSRSCASPGESDSTQWTLSHMCALAVCGYSTPTRRRFALFRVESLPWRILHSNRKTSSELRTSSGSPTNRVLESCTLEACPGGVRPKTSKNLIISFAPNEAGWHAWGTYLALRTLSTRLLFWLGVGYPERRHPRHLSTTRASCPNASNTATMAGFSART